MHPRDLLGDLNAAPLKSLSQNFLVSPHWAEKLVGAVLEGEKSEIWEIGPGLGALTEPLIAKSTVPVQLFEMDRKLTARLKERFPSTTLIEGDVLKQDWTALSAEKKVAVLSNLPYHLSSPILFRLTTILPSLHSVVMTFQKEFADRVRAGVGTPDYGGLSVVMAWYFKIESLGTVPPGAFYPPPKIDSSALRFLPLPLTVEEVQRRQTLQPWVRVLFQQRRKTLRNNLVAQLDAQLVDRILAASGLDPRIRAERLSPTECLSLAEHCHLAQSSAQASGTPLPNTDFISDR